MRAADQPIRISLVAPEGRMGKAIAKAVEDNSAYAIDQDHGDVLLDFSAPAAPWRVVCAIKAFMSFSR